MQDIPEAEARALLSGPLRCEDCDEWEPVRIQPGTFTTSAGVLDAHGVGTRLHVNLDYRNSQKTKTIKYVFSVFKRQPYGRDRVYQLEIVQSPSQSKDLHKRAHEHYGKARINVDASWCEWRYDEVLAYFCRQTNIAFEPKPPHPEHFQLKG